MDWKYTALSPSEQAAVRSRLMTGSSMPVGMLADMVIRDTRENSLWYSGYSGNSSNSSGDAAGSALLGLAFLAFFAMAGAGGSNKPTAPYNNSSYDTSNRSAMVVAPLSPPAVSLDPVPSAPLDILSATAKQGFAGYATVTATMLNLRSCPGIDCEIIAKMPQGAKVRSTGTALDGWWEVDYTGKNGEVLRGYASEDYLVAGDASLLSSPLDLSPEAFNSLPAASIDPITR